MTGKKILGEADELRADLAALRAERDALRAALEKAIEYIAQDEGETEGVMYNILADLRAALTTSGAPGLPGKGGA